MSITSNIIYDMQRDRVYALPTEILVRSNRRPITRIDLFNIDNVAPPTGLTISNAENGQANLDWTGISGTHDFYVVYVYKVSTAEVVQRIEGITLNSASVMGLENWKEYEFWVRASWGNRESGDSNHVFATPRE